ncbi:hypothetical protein [Streptomyces sp. NPDC059753]|uniref:hypothetical protein n=1 Tax=Streptomyces sp. NPDC059753 TaxID=3346933 RepID=UPI0036478747
MARGAARRAGDGVVGFDLAGDEALHPDVRAHAGAFALAGAAGLGLTCHAAEAGPASAAREAVEQLGVTRIGHGTHIADDAETMAWAADTGLTVEVCPTSNWYTGATSSLHDHPAPRFRRAGVRVVLGDDNPMQTRSLLSDEYRLLARDLGFDAPALEALDLAAVEAGFMDDGTRAALRRRASSSRAA